MADKLFGQKDLQVNLDNSVYGSSMQEGNYATLGGSTKLSIEKGALSIFTSRNASLSTGIYTPTVTTTTGAEYNAKTLGAHISQTNGSNVDVLNIGASVRYENLTARVEHFNDASIGKRTDLGLEYNPENGVNLNAGYSAFNGQNSVNMGIGVNNPNGVNLNAGYSAFNGQNSVNMGIGVNNPNGVNLNAGYSAFNGQKSVNMGIGVNNPNGLSPEVVIASNGDYTSTVRYKMMTLGLSKISQNQGFNFGTSFQF
ncbi:MAG: hypothetical protein WCG95_01110 [bacterium]